MRRLGISIYPDKGDISRQIEYIEQAARYGFSRIFTCLISTQGENQQVIDDFKVITAAAKRNKLEVIADANPGIFRQYNVDYRDLSFFHELKLDGVRLDTGFSGIEESIMTFNPYGIKIEINMSNGTRYLDNILSYKPNKENLIGCHNFYPHKYTGLSRAHFIKCSQQFKELGIHTAAFASSEAAEFGPWPVKEGLCTLEQHRYLPLDVQVKDLFNTDLIDDVIIANAFASEAEMKRLGELDKAMLAINVELENNLDDIYSKIVLEELHFSRGDVSEYMIRSTQSRVKYKNQPFPLFNPKPIKRGDILIESSLYERYAGELQIALKDMENSGKTNVVGRVVSEEVYLLDEISPWQKFRLKSK